MNDMDDLMNLFAGRASKMDGRLAQPRLAVITDVDPKTHTVRCLLQPGAVLSPWIPMNALAVGNGMGIVCPPSPGDQVLVVHQGGDAETPVVVGRVFSEKALPPSSAATGKEVQSGEFGIFCDGAFLHIAGGVVHIRASEIRTEGHWFHKGDMDVDGKLTVTGIIKSLQDVFAKAISLLSHVHGGVGSGSGSSGQPQ